jgi:hypothetical protein
MELQTERFGQINYNRQDELEVAGIEPRDSSWLLLADKAHPHLYWLQSTTDTARALPVCSLAGMTGVGALRLRRSQGLPNWAQELSVIALAEIRDEPAGCSLDLERPILIDPRTHRGFRLISDDDQAVQRALSDKVAPLRKCA